MKEGCARPKPLQHGVEFFSAISPKKTLRCCRNFHLPESSKAHTGSTYCFVNQVHTFLSGRRYEPRLEVVNVLGSVHQHAVLAVVAVVSKKV